MGLAGRIKIDNTPAPQRAEGLFVFAPGQPALSGPGWVRAAAAILRNLQEVDHLVHGIDGAAVVHVVFLDEEPQGRVGHFVALQVLASCAQSSPPFQSVR